MNAKQVFLLILCQYLQTVAGDYYRITLKGGDLQFVIGNISSSVVCLLKSQAITTFCVLVGYFFMSKPIVYLNFGLIIVQLFFVLTLDLGTDLEHHGQYNLFAYILTVLPFLISSFLCKFCYFVKSKLKNNQMFFTSLIGCSIVFVLYYYLRLESSRVT